MFIYVSYMFISLLFVACAPQQTADETHDSGPSFAAETPFRFEGAPPKNVLMLTLDTTRRALFARYGGRGDAAELDALFEQGVALDDMRSCSNWTYDSVLCAQSAATSIDLGFASYFPEGELFTLPAEVLLASEVMSERGYQTALVTGNWVTTGALGLNQGFDANAFVPDGRAEELTELGLSLYDAFDPSVPWYLHLHYIDPHAPYSPHPDYREALEALPAIPFDLESTQGLADLSHQYDSLSAEEQENVLQWLDALYSGEVRHLDDQIGVLFEELEARDALEDALVVIWADHGEQFFEHGDRGHGGSLFDEENAAAGLLWSPRLEPAAWGGPVVLQDLWPTILEALGQTPMDTPGGGRPLGQRLENEPRFAHRATDTRALQSVVMDGWKLIYDWDGVILAFDLNADPGEVHPITDLDNPHVEALWNELSEQVAALETVYTLRDPVDPGI